MWEPFSAKTRKVPGKPRQGGQRRACDCVLSRKEEKGSLVLRGRGKEMACETEKKVSGCGSLESVSGFYLQPRPHAGDIGVQRAKEVRIREGGEFLQTKV